MLIRPVQGPAFEGQDYAFLLAVLIFVHLRPSSLLLVFMCFAASTMSLLSLFIYPLLI